ncbi:hypothetical protein TYRP_009575 [Tyrophagus putrescentiae]|nr:hypothetical protein TYRP_009575 [Tyrophagus putrescentiae]
MMQLRLARKTVSSFEEGGEAVGAGGGERPLQLGAGGGSGSRPRWVKDGDEEGAHGGALALQGALEEREGLGGEPGAHRLVGDRLIAIGGSGRRGVKKVRHLGDGIAQLLQKGGVSPCPSSSPVSTAFIRVLQRLEDLCKGILAAVLAQQLFSVLPVRRRLPRQPSPVVGVIVGDHVHLRLLDELAGVVRLDGRLEDPLKGLHHRAQLTDLLLGVQKGGGEAEDARPLLHRQLPRLHLVVVHQAAVGVPRDAVALLHRPVHLVEDDQVEDARRRQEDRPLGVRRKAAHRLVEQVANEADGDERLTGAGGQQRHDVAFSGLGEDGSLEEKGGKL